MSGEREKQTITAARCIFFIRGEQTRYARCGKKVMWLNQGENTIRYPGFPEIFVVLNRPCGLQGSCER